LGTDYADFYFAFRHSSSDEYVSRLRAYTVKSTARPPHSKLGGRWVVAAYEFLIDAVAFVL
jgi:hypothetical protein